MKIFYTVFFSTICSLSFAQIEGTARVPYDPARELQSMRIVPNCAPGVPVTVSNSRFICSPIPTCTSTQILAGVNGGWGCITPSQGQSFSGGFGSTGQAQTCQRNVTVVEASTLCGDNSVNIPAPTCPTGYQDMGTGQRECGRSQTNNVPRYINQRTCERIICQ